MLSTPSSTALTLPAFAFVGGRLWLDFVNTDDARLGTRVDTIASFDRFVAWLAEARIVDVEQIGRAHV